MSRRIKANTPGGRRRLDWWRRHVRAVTTCPRCGAHFDEPCRGVRQNNRIQNHRERDELARQVDHHR